MDFQHFAPQIDRIPKRKPKEVASIAFWNVRRLRPIAFSWLSLRQTPTSLEADLKIVDRPGQLLHLNMDRHRRRPPGPPAPLRTTYLCRRSSSRLLTAPILAHDAHALGLHSKHADAGCPHGQIHRTGSKRGRQPAE